MRLPDPLVDLPTPGVVAFEAWVSEREQTEFRDEENPQESRRYRPFA